MRQGFSLVELSIVLVILGLLVGGILAGRSMIRAAEIRKVSSDFVRYKTAVYAFKDKYFAWPGDFSRATTLWPSDSSIRDGNQNGTVVEFNELVGGFNMLSSAGMIEGNYKGYYGPPAFNGGSGFVPGLHTPASNIQPGTFTFGFLSIDGNTSGSNMRHRLMLGGNMGNNGTNVGSVTWPEDAWNIDTKLDDGAPRTGLFTVGTGFYADTTCNWGSGVSSTYNLSGTGRACYALYLVD